MPLPYSTTPDKWQFVGEPWKFGMTGWDGRVALTKAKTHAISNLSLLKQIVDRYPTDYYLQDIIGIISDGRVKVFAGHGQLSAEAEAREIFANLASIRARNSETYEVLTQMFPEMIQEFENLFGGE